MRTPVRCGNLEGLWICEHGVWSEEHLRFEWCRTLDEMSGRGNIRSGEWTYLVLWDGDEIWYSAIGLVLGRYVSLSCGREYWKDMHPVPGMK